MKTNTNTNNGFISQLSTGFSDGCLVLVTVVSGFLSYHVMLASAAGY